MAYNYYILSTPDDFYMADAICRELEKTGASCYYNIRDSKKANRMPDNYEIIGSETSLISVVNEEFISNHSLSSPVSFYSKKTSDDKVFVLQNGYIKDYPEQWNRFRWLDATKGLNREMISIIKGEYEVVNNIPHIADTIEAAKDQENSYNNSSEKKEDGAYVMQIVPEVNSIELVSDQQENATSCTANLTYNRGEDNMGEGNSQSNTQSSHSSSIDNSNTGNDLNNEGKKYSGVKLEGTEAFIRRMQAEHANLPTIMTKMPKNTDDDAFFDRVSEAYLVPLYVLPFERCESIPNADGWFSNLQNPALTIQRALRYLYGNGVPQDENRAFSLFQKSVNEDSSSGEAKYCLGICKEVGLGTDVDVDSAIQLYKEALELGYPYAAARLGSIYYSEGNLELAKQFIQQARNNNDIESSYLLGLIAEDNGNLEDAIEYYSEAAELGDAKAQNAIAALYYNGTGVAQDEDIAIQWLNQSLDQGFNGALYNRLVYKLNAIDKAMPDWDELVKMPDEILALYEEFGKKRHTILKLPGIYYNFSILIRRANAPIETFKSWFNFPAYCKLPYVDEFYRHYENEKKRRKKSAIGKSVLNCLLTGMGNLQGTDNSAFMERGGLFDKEREI